MGNQFIDIALIQDDSGEFDIQTANQDLVMEDGLETAVIISLFTDARVDPTELPPGQTDLRGWWGDVVDPSPDGDQTGSKLWLLERDPASSETLGNAKDYCTAALAWMITEGVAKSVTVLTSFATSEAMLIQISIVKPDGTNADFQYNFAWTQQLQKGA